MKHLVTVIIFGVILLSLNAQESQLKKGDKAPMFIAQTDENKAWDLADYVGKKNIVVYFYPAAMTSGCTKQACAYRDNKEKLEKANAMVVGVSGDEVKNLEYFKLAHNLNFPLLSDYSGDIAKKYGVPTRDGSSISREINGETKELKRGITTRRWTFIIDKKGNIAYINNSVNAANDSEDVLEVLKTL